MECDGNTSAYESIESNLLSTSHENVNFDDENDLKPLPDTGQFATFFNANFNGKHFKKPNKTRVNSITYWQNVNIRLNLTIELNHTYHFLFIFNKVGS